MNKQQLTKVAVNKSIASKPYRLVITDEYGHTRFVAYGEYNDMVEIKAATCKKMNAVIEENRP